MEPLGVFIVRYPLSHCIDYLFNFNLGFFSRESPAGVEKGLNKRLEVFARCGINAASIYAGIYAGSNCRLQSLTSPFRTA